MSQGNGSDDDFTPPGRPVVANPANLPGVRVLADLVLSMNGWTLRLHQLEQSISRDTAPMGPERWGAVADVIEEEGSRKLAAAAALRKGA